MTAIADPALMPDRVNGRRVLTGDVYAPDGYAIRRHDDAGHLAFTVRPQDFRWVGSAYAYDGFHIATTDPQTTPARALLVAMVNGGASYELIAETATELHRLESAAYAAQHLAQYGY